MNNNGYAYIFGGIALGLVSVLLTEQNFCGGGFEGLWQGDWIIGTDIQSRWPLSIAVLITCWGLFQRSNSNSNSSKALDSSTNSE
jgi:hypothetical protein